MAEPREAGWMPRLPKTASVEPVRLPVTRWSFASHLNPSASTCLSAACLRILNCLFSESSWCWEPFLPQVFLLLSSCVEPILISGTRCG